MGMFDMIKDGIDKTVREVNETASDAGLADTGGFWGGNGDLDAVLSARADSKPGDYNWKTSVADLFRLLDLDPSYGNRKELAKEIGREDYSGTAEDNIWLHKEVMKKLAANGARVPDELKG